MISSKITKKQLIHDLKTMGIEEGDHLGLGLSFKSIGNIEGGPEEFVNSIIEAVGPNGTIMLASFSIPIYGKKREYVFNYKTTPAYTGLIPEIVRKRPDSVRSKHPSNSVVALGRLAEYLTKGHIHEDSEYEPYSRLARAEGKFLVIGIEGRFVGLRHQAQYQAGLLDKVQGNQKIKFLDDDGRIKIFIRKNWGGCVKKLNNLLPILMKKGLVKEGQIGNAKSFLVPARETLDEITEILKKNPEINLCDEITCLWCRQLEWKMGLYKYVERPKFFQTNTIFKYSIAAINWVRLKNLLMVVYLEEAIKKRLLELF